MSDVALRTLGLGKMYRIGGERARYRTLRDTLVQAAKRPLERIRHPGAATHASVELWALRGIDLEVNHGEALGIIGRNGAGKSTLLKILSRITEPTEGQTHIRGRVSSLLEVGTGFHAELTGRENIYLNGAILGMSRADIRSRFDEIVEFSEVGRFLDTPVKRYSSGMYVRLAFAVAAHLEPDILIVDEVLAVGDYAFQRKCLGQMEAAAGRGRTVLFVSHNLAAVSSMCSRAVLLEAGRLVQDGTPRDVIAGYLAGGAENTSSRTWQVREAPGDEYARLLEIGLRQNQREPIGGVMSSMPMEVVMTIQVERPSAKLQVGFELLTGEGLTLFQTFHTDTRHQAHLEKGAHRLQCTIPSSLLNQGEYLIRPAAALFCERWILSRADDAALRFRVVLDHPESEMWYSARSGPFAPSLEWSEAEGPVTLAEE
jgi:lipopolysaccharide transport system ATP-binding protein